MTVATGSSEETVAVDSRLTSRRVSIDQERALLESSILTASGAFLYLRCLSAVKF
jgi:hypothetical protein